MNAPYIVDREGHSKDKLTSMVYAVLHSAQSSGDPTHVYTVKRHIADYLSCKAHAWNFELEISTEMLSHLNQRRGLR